jgi:hypothetical protein
MAGPHCQAVHLDAAIWSWNLLFLRARFAIDAAESSEGP